MALLPGSDGASLEAKTMERFLFRLTPLYARQVAALSIQKCARGLIAKRLAQQMKADAQLKKRQSSQSSALPPSPPQCVVKEDPDADPTKLDPSKPRTALSRNQRRAVARKNAKIADNQARKSGI